MQTVDGRLILSPSDLNDDVECPHLTTLALAQQPAWGLLDLPVTATSRRLEFAALTVGGGRYTLPACRPILALEVGDGCRRRGCA